MDVKRTARGMRASSVLCALIVTGCATTSPPTPPALPTIPSPPAVAEPKPSGHYWAMLCELQLRLSRALNSAAPIFAQCSPDGLVVPEP